MFTLIKLFITSKIKSFIGSKYFIYFLFLFIILLSFYGTYHIGFNNGKSKEKLRLEQEYSVILEKRIKENEEVLKREFDKILENQKEKVRVEKVFVDREKIVEKIIEKSTSGLSNLQCEMSDEELEQLNKNTRKP